MILLRQGRALWPPSKIGAYASVEAGNAFLVKTTLFERFYTLFMAVTVAEWTPYGKNFPIIEKY